MLKARNLTSVIMAGPVSLIRISSLSERERLAPLLALTPDRSRLYDFSARSCKERRSAAFETYFPDPPSSLGNH